MTARKLSWFASKAGRRLTMGGVFSIGLGFSAYPYIPNSFLINEVKEIVQLYSCGQPVPVSPLFLERFETVLNDMNVPAHKKEFIKPFVVYGFRMFHAGSVYSKHGAIIGIPSNFNYSVSGDVNTANITIMNNPVNWELTDSKKFKDSLVLSEDAQKFLIGTEVHYVTSFLMYLEAAFPFVCTLLTYFTGRKLNKELNLLHRPLILRVILYTIIGLFGFGTWSFLQDYSMLYYESRADKELCSLGKNYIEGGVEVYSKLLQRNKALRELMGDSGKHMYTATGNNDFLFRQKHLPITHRKLYLESRLKLLETESVSI